MRKWTPFTFLFLTPFLFINTVSGQLHINEWMAKNFDAHADEAGEYDDWIEIYNAGVTAIDINGYFISDDEDEPTLFQIDTSAIINPGAFIVLWADDDFPQGKFHVGFKLDGNAGDFISLYSPDTMLVDSLSFGVQSDNISNGSFPDGSSTYLFFNDYTPGLPNASTGGLGITDAPAFSITGGFYPASSTLSLSVSDGDIYYTTDGSLPDETSTLYTSSLTISSTTVVRAIAIRTNYFPSPVISHNYFIGENYDLPVISIVTDPDNFFGANGIYDNPFSSGFASERPCQIQYFKNENLAFDINTGIRIQGGQSVGQPKKSFRLFMDGFYGTGSLNYALFEDTSVTVFNKLILRSGYDDDLTIDGGTLLRDPFSHRTFKKGGGEVSEGSYAALTLNGAFWGIYEIRENISTDFIDAHYGFDEYDMIQFFQANPDVEFGSLNNWNELADYIQNNDLSINANYSYVRDRLDIDNFVNFLAFSNIVANVTWTRAGFAYRRNTENARWRFIPWDLDESLENPSWNPYPTFTEPGGDYANFLPANLLENDQFRDKLLNRTADLLNTCFLYDDALAFLNSLKAEIEAEIPEEYTKWNGSQSITDWQTNIDFLDNFLNKRPNRLRNHILAHFELADTSRITLDVVGPGMIHLNTIDLPTYPWSGLYFNGIPVEVTAIPNTGYTFDQWSDINLPNEPEIDIDLDSAYTLTAFFVQSLNLGADQTICSGSSTTLNAFYEGCETCSYLWSTDETTPSINVSPGSTTTYTVTVTDNESNMFTDGVQVDLYSVTTSTISATNVSCNGDANGSVSVTASGGSGDYTYVWNTGANTAILTNLPVGEYNVTITDGNGCTATNSTMVTEPDALSTSVDFNDPNCVTSNDGNINLSVNGGTVAVDYTYIWNTGVTTQDINNLVPGTYSVTITDDNGCTAIEEVTLSSTGTLTGSIATDHVNCSGASTGSVGVTITGGNDPITYVWSTGATTSSLNGIPAGNYSVTVTDGGLCELTFAATITEPDALISEPISGHVDCFGDATGSAAVIVTGGSGDYSYIWNTGATTNQIGDLVAGVYTVTVSDENACTDIVEIEVTQNDFIAMFINPTNILCNGDSTGSVNLAVGGGGGTMYTFLWSNGSTNQNLENAPAGEYSVIVTDEIGCTRLGVTIITEPDAIESALETTDIPCGGTSGTIILTVEGGTGDHTFLWNNGQTTQNLSDLSVGFYEVTITDNNGCSHVAGGNINELGFNNELTIAHNICFGDEQGTANVTVTGGQEPLTYNWSTGATTSGIDMLPAGNYQVTIVDGAGCMAIETVEITQPNAIIANPTITNVDCNNALTGSVSLLVSGGNGGFTYLWSNDATTALNENLSAGLYEVTITDGEGCSQIKEYEITEPAVISIEANIIGVSCGDPNTGAISIITNGGTGDHTYLWSNEAITNFISNLSAGEYMVTITDENDCTLVETFTVDPAPELSLEAEVDAIVCFGDTNGAINITVGGGSDYTYSWSNGSNEEDLSDLGPGTYTVTVVDIDGCLVVESFELEEPDELFVGTVINHPTSTTNGSIGLLPEGGVEPYTVNWNTGDMGLTLIDLPAGEYIYTVTDGNGCTVVDTIELILMVNVTSLEDASLKIYPNPVTTNVFVELQMPATDEVELILYDITGRQMRYQQTTGRNVLFEMDVKALPAGAYNLVVKTKGGGRLDDVIIKE